MAVARFVKAWRGVTRHNLRVASKHLQSLVNYNSSHADFDPVLFSSGEATAVNAIITLLDAKLLQTKVK